MKKLILLLLICFPYFIQAQYFHKLYGNTNGTGLKSGVITDNIGQGHFITGIQSGSTSQPLTNLIATFTRLDGTVVFNRIISLQLPNGINVNVNDVQGFELKNLQRFGVIGTYAKQFRGTQLEGVFYITLDALGNVLTSTTYSPAISSLKVAKIGGVNLSDQMFGRSFYVAGTAYDNFSTYSFALNIESHSGNLYWGNIYDLNIHGSNLTNEGGADIIENPFTSINGAREILMIGNTQEVNQPHVDAYSTRINGINGQLVLNANNTSTIVYYAPQARWFNGICVANSSTNGQKGFMIAGSEVDFNTGHDFSLVKIDSLGNVLFHNTYPYNNYSSTINTTDILNNVIERENSFGTYEYYAVGHTTQGNIGNYDIVVLKTDENGIAVPNGQFTYGTTLNEYGYDVGQNNTTGNQGLSIFGSSNAFGNGYMYHVRAYFNGLSGCYERQDPPITSPNGLAEGQYLSSIVSDFQSNSIKTSYRLANDLVLCFNNSITNGSNARTAPKGEKAATISPNPFVAGTNYASIELDTEQPTNVTVSIYDMLGRNYHTSKHPLIKGSNNLTINISEANMAVGMYSLRITSEKLNQSIMLMVK